MMNKTAHEIRRENLTLLVDEYGSRDRLAARLDRERNQIDQLLAKKNMGPTLARTIEKKLGKARGWMDHEHLNVNGLVSDFTPSSSTAKLDRKRSELLKIWSGLSPDMRSHLLAIARSLTRKQ